MSVYGETEAGYLARTKGYLTVMDSYGPHRLATGRNSKEVVSPMAAEA